MVDLSGLREEHNAIVQCAMCVPINVDMAATALLCIDASWWKVQAYQILNALETWYAGSGE